MEFIRARGPFQGRILVPGCGLGHDVRAAAAAENAVIGFDLAPEAIQRAETWPKSAAEC